MLKNDYLRQPEVEAFTKRLAQVLNGETIKYQHNGNGDQYRTLWDAFNAYHWPNRTTPIEIPGQPRLLRFPPGGFGENEALLTAMQAGLRRAYQGNNNQELFGWMRAIMQWGGVYRYARNRENGNRGWLENNANGLVELLNPMIEQIVADNDDFSQIANLRFNAGTTKVYSLLRPNFIIYDSRVAAALAWLALQLPGNGQEVSDYLKFRCLPSQGGNHVRNPDTEIFPRMNNAGRMHATWNVRASWILSQALAVSKEVNPSSDWSLRKIEAALFIMGYDLRHAI